MKTPLLLLGRGDGGPAPSAFTLKLKFRLAALVDRKVPTEAPRDCQLTINEGQCAA
jgi:hypothetical protein